MIPRLSVLGAWVAISAACVAPRARPVERPGEEASEAGTEGSTDPTVWTLGEVVIRPSDIFSAEEADGNFLARLANATHHVTRADVIERELWISPGEPIRVADAEELERNLRAAGLFAEARVRLEPSAVPGVADLVIETEDRLSLQLGAQGSFIGSVSRVGASLGESNLFGFGDRIVVAFSEASNGEFRGDVTYRDRHFLGTWIEGEIRAARTEEGDSLLVGFNRPFKHLADTRSWRLFASTGDSAVDYYEHGETVVDVPLSRDAIDMARLWRDGPPDRQWTIGLAASHESIDYGVATGPRVDSIEVPGDTEQTFGGVSLGHRHVIGFKKVDRLDTIDYVQDLTLSTGFELIAGATRRDEDGVGERIEPTYGLGTNVAFEPFPGTFVSGRLGGRTRTRAGDLEAWNLGVEMQVFQLGIEGHTLAARIGFDEAFEGEGLPVRFNLGEDAGLRGYPEREFSGARMVRINLEDRIHFDARLGPVEFGAVVFADFGWIEERNAGFGPPYRSVGFGLRLGSDSLLGARVVRIDLAFPLDDFERRRFDPLVSLSLGQVFEFQ